MIWFLRNSAEDLSKLATFSTKIAESDTLIIEIQDLKRQQNENAEGVNWGKEASENSPPPQKIENQSSSERNLKTQVVSDQYRTVKPVPANEDPLLAEDDEKVNFKSFQILKIIGQGAFGKIFLVSFFLLSFDNVSCKRSKKRIMGRYLQWKLLKKKSLFKKGNSFTQSQKQTSSKRPSTNSSFSFITHFRSPSESKNLFAYFLMKRPQITFTSSWIIAPGGIFRFI